MSSQRTTHDFEHDVLRGETLESAKELAARLESKALDITYHLARVRAGLTTQVRLNLENERNGLEIEAFDWQSRIAEFQGKVTRVREPAPAPTARAALVERRQREAV